MIIADVHSPDYPRMDDRFQSLADEMSLDDCKAWVVTKPPEPEMGPGEQYMDFVQRQTFYAQYWIAVTNRRDKLLEKEKRLSLPKAPVGDDIASAIEWIVETGDTPIEFLVKAYRNGGNKIEARIAAAAKVMDFVHRKMPALLDPTKVTPEDIEKMSETVKQVEKVLAERMREQKKLKAVK